MRPGSPPNPKRGASQRQGDPASLAHDRAAQPEGLDRSERRRWTQSGGFLESSPGAALRYAYQPSPPEAVGELVAQLQARGAVRQKWPADPGTEGTRPQGPTAHGSQSSRQWRLAA